MDSASSGFDPRSPAFRADPFPSYAELRAAAPVYYWDVWDIWFLSRYDDCNALLRDARLGRGDMGLQPPAEQQALYDMQGRWMLLKNPPDHTRLRGLHYCLGAPLARLEGQIAIGSLLRRMPDLALAAEVPVYRDNLTLRGLRTLPVMF
jgi:cytochrome P450